MTLIPLMIFIICCLFLIGLTFLLAKILSVKRPPKAREIYEMGMKGIAKEHIPIKFHIPAILFLFWAVWLFFFLFPWILIYQQYGLNYELTSALLCISSFFIIGYLIASFSGAFKNGDGQ